MEYTYFIQLNVFIFPHGIFPYDDKMCVYVGCGDKRSDLDVYNKIIGYKPRYAFTYVFENDAIPARVVEYFKKTFIKKCHNHIIDEDDCTNIIDVRILSRDELISFHRIVMRLDGAKYAEWIIINNVMHAID